MLDPRPQAEPPRPARRPQRRLPRHVYWRRRILVLGVAGVIGWASVVAIGGMFGDDGPASEAGDATAVDPDPAAENGAPDDAAQPVNTTNPDVDDTGDTEETDDAGDSTAAEGLAGAGEPEGVDPAGSDDVIDAADGETTEITSEDDGAGAFSDGPPSTSNPAKVHIVGDSDAGTFGPYLQTLLDNTLLAETSLDYKVSSGLARPDFFNWPEQLRSTLPEVDPDVVVVTFGGNDSQGLSKPQADLEFLIGDPSTNEAEWSAEYERRVLEVLDILLESGREVVWVGIPNDDNPDVTAKLRIQDQAVRAAIEQRPDVVFVDTWTRFSGRDGNWAEFVVDPRDGVGKDVRADDGFHLNTTGAEILAIDIAVEVRDILRDRGAAI